MPVTEELAAHTPTIAHQSAPPHRVARCLFGRPDPEELDRMEAEIEKETRERALRRYGVDLQELTRREDIDTLVVRCITDTEEIDVTAHVEPLKENASNVNPSIETISNTELSNETISNIEPLNGSSISNVNSIKSNPSEENSSICELQTNVQMTHI